MTPPSIARPRVFIDSDVLFSGSVSPSTHGASITLLRMGEITLIDAVVSEQVISEVERNLTAKLPAALTLFRLLASRAVRVVPAPQPDAVAQLAGLADPKDLPILVAAVQSGCPLLATYNVRHYQPGHPSVEALRPGDLLLRIRHQLAQLAQRGYP